MVDVTTSTSSGFNAEDVFNNANDGLNKLAKEIVDGMKDLDVSDPSAMLQLQMKEGQYEAMLKMVSAMESDIKNTCNSIAQKSG